MAEEIRRLRAQRGDMERDLAFVRANLIALQAAHAVTRAALILAMHFAQTTTVKSDARETLLEACYLAAKLPRTSGTP
jgi:hypothetical protein